MLPFLAALVSLPLVGRIAWLALQPTDSSKSAPTGPRADERMWGVVLTVGLFAASYYPLRYACEVKPYGIDLTTSALLLWLALEWRRSPNNPLWPLALIVATPVSVATSFTAVLAAGAVTAALAAWAIVSFRPWRVGAATILGITLIASFLILRDFTTQPGQAALSGELTQYWADSFPPHTPGLGLLIWLFRSHTSELLAYPVGGQNGASLVTAICVVLGVVHLLRTRRTLPVAIFATMLALLFVAAWLRKYPYGGHTRLVLFLAPLVCLLAAVGVQTLLAHLSPPHQGRLRGFLLTGLLVLIGASAVRDVTRPWKSEVDARHRQFARAFWAIDPGDGWQTVSLSRHRSQTSAPQLCDFAYRVERALSLPAPIPELGRLIPPELSDQPLRCVVYQNATAPRHEGDYQVWRRAVAESHTVVAIDQYALPVLNDQLPDLYEVYWLVPNGRVNPHPGTPSEVAGQTAQRTRLAVEPPPPVRIAAVEGRRL